MPRNWISCRPTGLRKESKLAMIPECNSEQQPLPPRRLVHLPNNVTGCHNDEYEKKEENEDNQENQKEEFDPSGCKTPPPNEEIPGSSAQQELENLRKARNLVVAKSKKYIPPGQSYTALNVKATNRTSENLAQYINKKEDGRLAKKLNSIDREKTVFTNSITRDEKILLQRSKALATVLLARTDSNPEGDPALASASSHKLNRLPRQISTSTTSTRARLNRSTSRLNQIRPPLTSAPLRRVVSSPAKPCTAKPKPAKLFTIQPKPVKPKTAKPLTAKSATVKSLSEKPSLLYGEDVKRVAPLKRSKTANIIRSVSTESSEPEEKVRPTPNQTNTSKARLLWANSVDTIIKRDIKAWHKAFLVSQNGNCVRVKPNSISLNGKHMSTSPQGNFFSASSQGNHMPSIPDRTPQMPEIVADKPLVSPPVIKERLDPQSLSRLFSDREMDKGAWITNYINTSCAEHFPMI
ncbi:uncharacterized protein LOC134811654 isoform X2 [Bolinopsis microptera]|uniref:uncharacterized protein LOC134811654 isoform X2 n=2 Tax=Bolinopsis microptera TaxID=2820187 RepID=UPI003078F592